MNVMFSVVWRTEVKFCLFLLKQHAMTEYRGVEV